MKIADFDFRTVTRYGFFTTLTYSNEAKEKLSELLGTDTDAEIELFSGLTDSEGVKIYENDIVEGSEDGERYEVENTGDCFMLKKGSKYYGLLGSEILEQGLRVVSNIHIEKAKEQKCF